MGTNDYHEIRTTNTKVSIQLMSPASGDLWNYTSEENLVQIGFHSINVPSEWGLKTIMMHLSRNSVSIQLMSPASGDWESSVDWLKIANVSIQLMSPASGDKV